MPSAVMNLLLLLGEEGGMPLPGEQVELIQDAIGKNRSDIVVPFLLPRLCARYAQRQVPAQKKILKDLERLLPSSGIEMPTCSLRPAPLNVSNGSERRCPCPLEDANGQH